MGRECILKREIEMYNTATRSNFELHKGEKFELISKKGILGTVVIKDRYGYNHQVNKKDLAFKSGNIKKL